MLVYVQSVCLFKETRLKSFDTTYSVIALMTDYCIADRAPINCCFNLLGVHVCQPFGYGAAVAVIPGGISLAVLRYTLSALHCVGGVVVYHCCIQLRLASDHDNFTGACPSNSRNRTDGPLSKQTIDDLLACKCISQCLQVDLPLHT